MTVVAFFYCIFLVLGIIPQCFKKEIAWILLFKSEKWYLSDTPLHPEVKIILQKVWNFALAVHELYKLALQEPTTVTQKDERQKWQNMVVKTILRAVKLRTIYRGCQNNSYTLEVAQDREVGGKGQSVVYRLLRFSWKKLGEDSMKREEENLEYIRVPAVGLPEDSRIFQKTFVWSWRRNH